MRPSASLLINCLLEMIFFIFNLVLQRRDAASPSSFDKFKMRARFGVVILAACSRLALRSRASLGPKTELGHLHGIRRRFLYIVAVEERRGVLASGIGSGAMR